MSEPVVDELAPSVFCVQLHDDRAHQLNCYLWLAPHGVTLIDCGWPDSAPVIEQALAEVGRGRRDVERLVLTHFHEDHAGSADEITRWADLEVCAGRRDAPYISGDEAGPLPRLTPAERAIHPGHDRPPAGPPCRIDRLVDDGDHLDPAGDAHVIAVPGHTPGSIALHLTSPNTLLTGDAMAEFNGAVILGVFNTDRTQARQSQATLAATGATSAGFGHGKPVLTDAATHIASATDPFAP